MAPFFHGFAALTGNVRIAKDAVCDKNKPNTFLIQCDVQVEKIGAMNIQVYAYVPSGAPALNSIYYLSGTMLFPEGDADAMVFSSQFDLIIAPAGSPDKAMPMPPATVWILGKVKTVINKDWFLDVSTYDRITRSMKTFQVVVTVPDSPRHEKLKSPSAGSLVVVHGILSDIRVHEEVLSPVAQLNSVTFLPRSIGDVPSAAALGVDSSSGGVSVTGKTKRQLLAEAKSAGSPMKKSKTGNVEDFTASELAPKTFPLSPAASQESQSSSN